MTASSATALDRSSPIPLHHQLKLVLAAMIRSGVLRPGDPLPGELRLCEQYDVSRTVVRQTLAQMEFEGLVERVRGRGTFVASARPAQGLIQSLTGQFEDLAARGLHLRSAVRRLELLAASPKVARAMAIPENTEVVVLERLRYVRDEPWVLVVTYLPAESWPWLQYADLREGSLYEEMEAHGMRPMQGRRTLQAVGAGKALAHDLGVGRGAAILRLTSLSVDHEGKPVEFYEAFHRGDRTIFEVDLGRSHAIL